MLVLVDFFKAGFACFFSSWFLSVFFKLIKLDLLKYGSAEPYFRKRLLKYGSADPYFRKRLLKYWSADPYFSKSSFLAGFGQNFYFFKLVLVDFF